MDGGASNPPIFLGKLGLLLIIGYALGNTMLMVFSLTPYRRFTIALLRGRWVRH
jgi:hypothetical protein